PSPRSASREPAADHNGPEAVRRGGVAYARMSLVERLRADVGSHDGASGFTFDERVVASIATDTESGTSQERYQAWRDTQAGARAPEYLLPRVVRHVECAWPRFMGRAALPLSNDELRERLAPLGPWYVPFALGD